MNNRLKQMIFFAKMGIGLSLIEYIALAWLVNDGVEKNINTLRLIVVCSSTVTAGFALYCVKQQYTDKLIDQHKPIINKKDKSKKKPIPIPIPIAAARKQYRKTKIAPGFFSHVNERVIHHFKVKEESENLLSNSQQLPFLTDYPVFEEVKVIRSLKSVADEVDKVSLPKYTLLRNY